MSLLLILLALKKGNRLISLLSSTKVLLPLLSLLDIEIGNGVVELSSLEILAWQRESIDHTERDDAMQCQRQATTIAGEEKAI